MSDRCWGRDKGTWGVTGHYPTLFYHPNGYDFGTHGDDRVVPPPTTTSPTSLHTQTDPEVKGWTRN